MTMREVVVVMACLSEVRKSSRQPHKRTSESKGHWQTCDSGAAFDLKSLGRSCRAFGQGLQIGGTRPLEVNMGWALNSSHLARKDAKQTSPNKKRASFMPARVRLSQYLCVLAARRAIAAMFMAC